MIKARVPVPRSSSATSLQDAIAVAKQIRYPVIIRVAYTLGGKGSGVAHDEMELVEIVNRALAQSIDRSN
jgi:carbamoyl-phosphate synthase large subunit